MRVRGDRWVQVTTAMMVVCFALVPGTAPALAAEPPPYHSSFGPDGTAATQFKIPQGVAVDQGTRIVYVFDRSAGGNNIGALYKFDNKGHPVAFGGSGPNIVGNTITGLPCTVRCQVAVDPVSHDLYVMTGTTVAAFHANGEPSTFTAGPGAGTNKIPGFGSLKGLAVDPNGTIYASNNTSTAKEVKIYAHSGAELTHFAVVDKEAKGPENLAVDNKGAVYVNLAIGPIEKYVPSTFPVTAATTYTPPVQPLEAQRSATVAVDPTTNDVYAALNAPSFIAKYSETGALLATFAGAGEPGEAPSAVGIAVLSEEEEVFVSNNQTGRKQVLIFWEQIVAGPPLVKKVSAQTVAADTAVLRARINPSRAATTYSFQYGTGDCAVTACASVPVPGAAIGDGHKWVDVSQSVTGLQPGTVYHYRVLAENAFGDNLALEGDHTFMTETVGLAFTLPDERAWELVSPRDKHGATVDGPWPLVQASADGGGVVYPSVGSTEENPEGARTFEPTSVLSRRTQQGWLSADLMHPNDEVEAIPVSSGGEYKLFSRDLSRAVLEPRSRTLLSPEADRKTPYLRWNTEPPAYQPLVAAADVPAGTEEGEFKMIDGNRDLSSVVISSSVPLAAGAPPAPQRSLYVWNGGGLQPVSVLPAAQGGAIVATDLLGSGPGSLRHAISDDGSRAFWSTGEFGATTINSITGLYLRDIMAGETGRIDAVQAGGSGAGTIRPTFQGASADGTVVFFTDSQQLTEGAGAGGRDLYRCEIPAGQVVSGCASLINITAETQSPTESAEVQGLTPAVADDGKTIYFVAKGVLDSVPNGTGQSAVPGKANLYVWQQGQGVRFIATLSLDDLQTWGILNAEGVEHHLTAAGSPGGRYLAFMSQLGLTGIENLDVASGEPVQQVYRYDAAGDRLVCVSCKPTGAAPDGELIPAGVSAGDSRRRVDSEELWKGSWVAATVPERPQNDPTQLSFYTPRYVLDNGRVFFNSVDSLVPGDSNRQWDVYQYESLGTGDCTDGSRNAATAVDTQGCVSLISSGTAQEEAGFLDASESGDDVFFLTSARLNEPDRDQEVDVYDARVDGVPATLPSISQCLGEACQPHSSAPSPAAPASAAFSGAGNLSQRNRHCRRGRRAVRRHGKVVCVRVRHKRHRHQGHRTRAGSHRGWQR